MMMEGQIDREDGQQDYFSEGLKKTGKVLLQSHLGTGWLRNPAHPVLVAF